MSEAFEFTPMGPRPLAEPIPGGVIPASEAIAKMRAQVDAQERTRAPVEPSSGEVRARALLGKPGSLKKQIRERLKLVNAELRRMRALEREAAELKRLLAAVKAPPAGVTHITSARKSG